MDVRLGHHQLRSIWIVSRDYIHIYIYIYAKAIAPPFMIAVGVEGNVDVHPYGRYGGYGYGGRGYCIGDPPVEMMNYDGNDELSQK